MDITDIIEIAKNITADVYTIQQFRDKTVLDKKLCDTPIPSREELKKIGEAIRPFLKSIKIKTAEFGDETIN
jgi:pyruvate formate lyase activating enzyme